MQKPFIVPNDRHLTVVPESNTSTPVLAESRYFLSKRHRHVEEIDGRPCETYIDWFSITFALTMTSCPVVSIPCGFTAEGLPVGIQILGKPRGEAALLRAADRLEEILGIAEQLPLDPR